MSKKKTEETEETYSIYRYYRDESKHTELIKEGLTLKEAKEHCQSSDTKGDGWFDGFVEE